VSARLNGAGASAWSRALAVAGIVVLVDQVSKEIVRDSVAPGERISLVFGIDLAHVSNRGIAFGLFGDGGDAVLIVTATALALVLLWFARHPSQPGFWLAAGLLFGGALGNLADRVRQDAVTDFVDLPLWPAFNVADVAITAGAIVLVLSAFASAESG
jgi:signal peptidase II